MLNGEDPESNLYSSSFHSYSNNPYDDSTQEDPSFLAPRRALYEEAGILGISAAKNIPQLTEVWMNERNAPELLPYERSLVEPLIAAIEKQAEFVMDQVEDKFAGMIYQTEIERIKFLLKSYLRVRLSKIEKYTLYILRQENSDELLSPQEVIYARRYQELIEAHNHDSFLHQLPKIQHRQDEVAGDLNMVVEPNFDTPVFVKVIQTLGHVQIKEDEVLFEKDDIIFLRYNDVKRYLRDGKVRLV